MTHTAYKTFRRVDQDLIISLTELSAREQVKHMKVIVSLALAGIYVVCVFHKPCPWNGKGQLHLVLTLFICINTINMMHLCSSKSVNL